MQLSWTPERKGNTYCAPACGRGCTNAEHERAVQKAAKLAATLGPSWKPHVWENLGWHYCAHNANDSIAVHEYPEYQGKARYTAFITHPGDLPGGRWTGEGETPRAAVEAGIAKALADRDEINKILEATTCS